MHVLSVFAPLPGLLIQLWEICLRTVQGLPPFETDRKGSVTKLLSVTGCFSAKSIHLELITDLTTEAFNLAFRCFVARRGKLLHVYSDNSTNFPLTPAHFLIGRPMTALADPDVIHISESRLSTFQRVPQFKQNLWKRWSLEYIP
ncbi:hypothetical protein D910_11982, partial [Dendroctonus ponderosae]